MKSVLFMLLTILVYHTMEYGKAEEVELINTKKSPEIYKEYSHSAMGRDIKDLSNMTNDDTRNLQPYCRRLRDGDKIIRKRWFKNVMKWAGNLIGKGHKEKQKPLNPHKQKVTKSTKRTTRKPKIIRTTKKPRTIRTTRKPKIIITTRKPKTTRKSTFISTTRKPKTIRITRKTKTIRTTTKPTSLRTTTKPTTIITTRIERPTTKDRKIIDDMEYAFDVVESILKNFKRFTKSSSSSNIEITVGSPRSTSKKTKPTIDDYFGGTETTTINQKTINDYDYEVTGSTRQELITTKNYDYESTEITQKGRQTSDDNDYEGTETTRQPNTSVIRKGNKTTENSDSMDIDHDYYYYL